MASARCAVGDRVAGPMMAPRVCALALAGVLLSLAGCRVPVAYDVKPGRAPRCTGGVCVEVVWFASHHEAVGAWIETPPGTRLLNAHLLPDQTPPCQGEMPVKWVTLDQTAFSRGPLDVGGKHGIVLGFPINAWWGRSGYWREMFVDIDLEVEGRSRCLRTRLTASDGKPAVGL